MNDDLPLPDPRYCARCGETFSDGRERCPACGSLWTPATPLTLPAVATLLGEFRGLREAQIIGPECYAALRRIYERRLSALQNVTLGGRATVPAMAAVPVTVGGPAQVEPAPAGPPLSAPPALPPIAAGDWLAARQADVLLYLGAFLLSIAALIFVGYQGEALGGPARFVILCGYTVAFLSLGLLLPRWERVREAATVFLGLGALLVPVTIVALRTQVLAPGAVPDDVLALGGASLTAALYFALALRGHGVWYAAPGALAALIGWGALASVLGLRDEWFGSWYAGGVALVSARYRWRPLPGRSWVFPSLAVIGAGSVLVAHLYATDMARGCAWTLELALENPPPRPNCLSTAGLMSAQLPLTYLFLSGALACWFRERTARGWLPVTGGMTLLTAAWAGLGLSSEWYGAVLTSVLFGYLALTEHERWLGEDGSPKTWSVPTAVAAAVALFVALGGTGQRSDQAALPFTCALTLAGALIAAVGFGWASAWRSLPLLTTLTALATLRAAGAPVVWWAYAGLAVVALLLAAHQAGRLPAPLAQDHWWMAVATALFTPLLFVDAQLAEPAHGMAVALLGAAVLGFVAWQMTEDNIHTFVSLLLDGPPQTGEEHPDTDRPNDERDWPAIVRRLRIGLLFGGVGLLVVAGAYLNALIGARGSEQAWVFAVLASLAWATAALLAGRWPRSVSWVGGVGLTVSLLALWLAGGEARTATLVALIGVAGPLVAFVTAQRWAVLVVAAAFALTAIGFGWRWQAWQIALLPLSYAGVAAVLWGTLLPARRRGERPVDAERRAAEGVLAWGVWGVALFAALVALTERGAALPHGRSIVTTREWATLTLTVALTAAAVTAEGLGRRTLGLLVGGTAGLLLAGLGAIAITQPESIQAFTLPVAVYLLALGLVLRRISAGLRAESDGVTVLGLAFLLLPPAAQSFGPDSGRYGIQVLLEGALLLVLGLTLTARWFIVGGVLAVSGVAVRWLLIFGQRAPYWLTLGLLGMALLAVGMTLLLQRDRWDRLRERLTHWWERDAATAGR